MAIGSNAEDRPFWGSSQPTPETTAAVVVTYHPDASIEDRLQGIREQVGHVAVVDNGSTRESRRPLRRLNEDDWIHLVENEDNLGVAAALNQGIRWARDAGFSWVLLLDQDTRIEDHMVEHLIDVFDAYPHKDELAIIGAGWRWEHLPASDGPSEPPDSPAWVEEPETSAVTSGTYLPVRTFDRLGPFREDFFIDHVDTEYALRIHREGLRVIRTKAPLMIHGFGNPRLRALLGCTVTVYNHSPQRWYYQARNAVRVAREYGGQYPAWIWRIANFHLRNFTKMLLFEEDRTPKLRQAFKGFWHGLRGVGGPIEEQAADPDPRMDGA